MKKLFGYLLAALGLIGLFLSTDKGRTLVPFLDILPKNYMTIGSLIIVGLGVVILIATGSGGSEKSLKEVPIYEGKKIIGYRRHHK